MLWKNEVDEDIKKIKVDGVCLNMMYMKNNFICIINNLKLSSKIKKFELILILN